LKGIARGIGYPGLGRFRGAVRSRRRDGGRRTAAGGTGRGCSDRVLTGGVGVTIRRIGSPPRPRPSRPSPAASPPGTPASSPPPPRKSPGSAPAAARRRDTGGTRVAGRCACAACDGRHCRDQALPHGTGSPWGTYARTPVTTVGRHGVPCTGLQPSLEGPLRNGNGPGLPGCSPHPHRQELQCARRRARPGVRGAGVSLLASALSLSQSVRLRFAPPPLTTPCQLPRPPPPLPPPRESGGGGWGGGMGFGVRSGPCRRRAARPCRPRRPSRTPPGLAVRTQHWRPAAGPRASAPAAGEGRPSPAEA
jgi:hypothetical protein